MENRYLWILQWQSYKIPRTCKKLNLAFIISFFFKNRHLLLSFFFLPFFSFSLQSSLLFFFFHGVCESITLATSLRLLSLLLLSAPPALLSICYSFSLSFHSTGLTIPLLMEYIQKLKRNDYKEYWILLKKTNTAYMYLMHTFTLKIIFSNSNSCYFPGTQGKLHHVPCQVCQWLWTNSPKRTGEAIFAIPVMYVM